MGGRHSGYYLGPLEALGGAALSAFVPGGAAIGVPMMTGGLGTTIGQAAGGQRGSQIGGLLGGLAGGVGEAGFGLGGMGPLSSQLGPGGSWRSALSNSPVGKMLGGGAGDAAGGGSTWSGDLAVPKSPGALNTFKQGFTDQMQGKGPLPTAPNPAGFVAPGTQGTPQLTVENLKGTGLTPSDVAGESTDTSKSWFDRHPAITAAGTAAATRALGGGGGQSQQQPSPPPGRTMPSSGQGATPFAPPIVTKVPQSNAPQPGSPVGNLTSYLGPLANRFGNALSNAATMPSMAQLQSLLQRLGGSGNPPQMGSMGWGTPGNQG
ncbi:MAG TPA: hypothetical protein VKD24_07140 [Candidatus Angelobacter sp.]|nr:hypothetical protein [Candidatus Angelobacter sp.]